MYYSTCCGAKAIEDFKDNPRDHHDPIEIYTCSECGQECEEVTDEPKFNKQHILKILEAKYYKIAWKFGLSISGVEDNLPLWIGNDFNLKSYFKFLEANNLI